MMQRETMPTAEDAPAGDGRVGRARKPYRAPRLTCYGDLRGVTLGGTPGVGDSPIPGDPTPRDPLGFP